MPPCQARQRQSNLPRVPQRTLQQVPRQMPLRVSQRAFCQLRVPKLVPLRAPHQAPRQSRTHPRVPCQLRALQRRPCLYRAPHRLAHRVNHQLYHWVTLGAHRPTRAPCLPRAPCQARTPLRVALQLPLPTVHLQLRHRPSRPPSGASLRQPRLGGTRAHAPTVSRPKALTWTTLKRTTLRATPSSGELRMHSQRVSEFSDLANGLW